jgi:flagellar protein FliS
MSTYPLPGSALSGQTRGAMAYRTVGAQSSSPLELVVMLYDGAIRFLQEARDANDRQDVWGRARGTSKALAIVAELHNTLNLDEGENLAHELDRLYDYMMGRLLDVTMKRDNSALEEVQGLLRTIREGWVQASAASPPRP